MPQDIRFIRLDDDICELLNRQADQTNCRVSDLANNLIRLQLRTTAEENKANARKE